MSDHALRVAAVRWLAWHAAMGADERIASEPFSPLGDPLGGAATGGAAAGDPAGRPPADSPRFVPASPASSRAIVGVEAQSVAEAMASAADTLDALEAAIRAFDLCALKATAGATVFADGDPHADLMVLGEAPGPEEDKTGRPFVGPSGRLLDQMLAAIGLARGVVRVSNVLFWRPPGNRSPTPAELALCAPFVRRHIVLSRPKVLVLSGGAAAKTVLGRSDGITRIRGRWFDYKLDPERPAIPAMAIFHPSYLLRSPAQKRETWRDLQAIRSRLAEPPERL